MSFYYLKKENTNIIFIFIVQVLLTRCADILAKVEVQTSTMVGVVKTAIDEKIWEQGHMTADKLTESLGNFKTDMLEAHRKEIAELREELGILGSIMKRHFRL